MKNKTLFNSLLFTFSLLGSFFVLDKPVKADSPVCPDPEEITISSVYNMFDQMTLIVFMVLPADSVAAHQNSMV